MMSRLRALALVGVLGLLSGLFISSAVGCQLSPSSHEDATPEESPLVVFAAMSLKEPVAQIITAYEKQTGTEVTLQLAGSNRLAHQIEASRKQDVFLSASPQWTDYLVQAKIAPASEVKPLASNRLVVVVHERSPIQARSLDDLRATDVRRLSLAEPRGVPAGRYARAALSHEELWEVLQAKIVPGSNVRSALQLVTADLHVAGFVYRTDAAQEPRVRTLFEIPPELTGPIVYTVAPLRRSEAEPRAAAREFVKFCLSDIARKALTRHGFEAP